MKETLYSVSLLTNLQECLKDDGVRIVQTLDQAQHMFGLFEQYLQKWGLKYRTLDVLDKEERVKEALKVFYE